MSRIGKQPIAVPAGVEVKTNGSTVTAKGPQGELTGTFNSNIGIELDGAVIDVVRRADKLMYENKYNRKAKRNK